jgi:leader peptidase (prepilin peptidase)/N-methyltransferase
MTILISFFFFLYGLVFGSFFNVVGLRVPKRESIIRPPSHCPSCNRKLTSLDLIPVFSWIILRGKCRSCETKISWIYPATELVTGILFAIAYINIGFSFELIVGLLFISLLIIVTVSDIAYMLIPDRILLFFGILLLFARMISPLTPWWDSALGAFGGFGLLFLIAVLSNGGMGGGDIKLFFVIGLVLGVLPTLLVLFLAAFIGAIVGFIQIKINNQDKKTPIPFGPSISLACIIVYFYGANILEWYNNLLF